MPWLDQLRAGDPKGVVQRLDADHAHPLPGLMKLQLHQRVASARLDVALSAVRVEVRSRPCFQALASVRWIDERGVFLNSLRQLGAITDLVLQRGLHPANRT